MSIPILAPFSISLIERIELDFNITEGTYIEQKAAIGKLCITPKLKPKDFEEFRKLILKSSKTTDTEIKEIREELRKLEASPYNQYVAYLDPPSIAISRLFSRRKKRQREEFEHEILLGYLLIGGTETIDFNETPPVNAKGVIPIKMVISKGKFAEVEKEAKKEIAPNEYAYNINFNKIKELIENVPEIRKELFLRKTSFEIREPLWIEPSAHDAIDIFPKLDGKGPRGQIWVKVQEFKEELKRKGLSEDEISKRVVWYKRQLEEKIWEEAKELEKFYGLTALALSLKNVSSFPIEGDIYIEELALNFPISFSRYYFFTNVEDPTDPNNQIVTKYDPVRMQAIWNGIWLKKYKDEEKGIPHEGITLYLLVPHDELSKVHKITGEIKMQIMVESRDGPPLASLLYLQQACDSRGIPILEELEQMNLVDIRTSATSQIAIDPTSIYYRRIAHTRIVTEFEGVHPEKALDTTRKILESMGCIINYIEGPKELSGIEKDFKEFTSWIKCTKYVEVTPIYIDVLIEGKLFTTLEEKMRATRQFKTKIKHIPKEHGNTKITLRAASPNREVLRNFIDELQKEIKNVFSALTLA